MTLLLGPAELTARATVAAGPLRPLAQSLAHDLSPLLGREPFVPREKAMLTRAGGRCPRDGSGLTFNPFEPQRHVCPVCGEAYTGESHYRAWITWYQLWLAERAVHGAALGALGFGDEYTALARSILELYAERYAEYPNRDNVLGPTRLFFSTYLESIWLLQLCIATDLLDATCSTVTGALVRDRIVEPSSALIAQYDEGGSNRQVWNGAALLASSLLLDRTDDAEQAVYGASGLTYQLGSGLLDDGTWFEGENYHLFAHRGLWYGVTMAERANLELPDELTARFQEGFATPFLSAFPDQTLPSRRDSQYAISTRQWRFAELAELGLARRDDQRLVGALARLYEQDIPRGETGRATSSAEAERNFPASALSRSDLGWRSLLSARPELPPLVASPQGSALLGSQGLAILRRDSGRVYVALDYGHSGGGHGHPDRLNLLLADGSVRWLPDFGTGSYVDPSLHWYRSTLAHNAPLVDGASQIRTHGELEAYEERGGAGWISAVAEIAPGVSVRRRVVVMPDYALDIVTWDSDGPLTFDLPIHLDAELLIQGQSVQPVSADLTGSRDSEDGFRFAHDTAIGARAAALAPVVLLARSSEARLACWSVCDQLVEWWRLVAPGPPGYRERPLWLARSHASKGLYALAWDWSGLVRGVSRTSEATVVELSDGERHLHELTDSGSWKITLECNGARSSIDLAGVEPAAAPVVHRAGHPQAHLTPDHTLRRGHPMRVYLGEPNYRRSEETWAEAGSPEAEVSLEWRDPELVLSVNVLRSELNFVAAGTENPLDNENADINGDGVQLYIRTPAGHSAWVLVPESGGESVRTRHLEGWAAPLPLSATWHSEGAGYEIEVHIQLEHPLPDIYPVALDIIVNEKPANRERRRGQLVLSGAAGEFVYLRGDRHDPRRLIPIRLAD